MVMIIIKIMMLMVMMDVVVLVVVAAAAMFTNRGSARVGVEQRFFACGLTRQEVEGDGGYLRINYLRRTLFSSRRAITSPS